MDAKANYPGRFGVQLTELAFNDGTKVHLERGSILVLTGPNNCGKSQCLRDIVYNTLAKRSDPVVVKNATFDMIGGLSKFLDEFEEKTTRTARGYDNMLKEWVKENKDRLVTDPVSAIAKANELEAFRYHSLLKNYLNYMNTPSRLTGFGEAGERSFRFTEADKFFTKAIDLQPIFESLSLERKFYSIVSAAFGTGVLLNRNCFGESRLFYLNRQTAEGREDVGEPSYADWFNKQPALEDQGDGVNAFCNITLNLISTVRPLILIDEPEAFLHPPQIRALARVIAQESGDDAQVILATHSHDLVQGLIDFAPNRTSVLRLSRASQDNVQSNKIAKLNSDDIKTLWIDPLLRVSDALSSLFHHVAVIVEGDSDARFIRMMLDAVMDDDDRLLDLRFIHCGGKDRIAKISKALKSIGVPIVCVVDIDIFDDKSKLLTIIQSFGGSANDFEALSTAVLRYVAEQRSVDTAGDARENIMKLFEKADSKLPIPKDTLSSMQDALRASSAWSHVKRSGEAFFKRGEPYNNVHTLITRCLELGIIVNEHGELENLCKTVEARKGDWLAKVLEKDLQQDDALSDARQFVKKVVDKCKSLVRC